MFGISFELTLLGLIGLLAAAGITLWVVMRPFHGLVFLLGVSLLIERFPFKDAVTALPQFYDNLNATLGVPGLFVNPMEILIGLIGLGWIMRYLSHADESLRIQTISLLGFLWGGWLCFSVAWGVVNGGNWKVALWVIRPALYFLAVSFLVFQLVKTERQVRILATVFIIAVTIKSAQIIFRKFVIPEELEAYGEHEDTSFALWVAWMVASAFFLPFPKVMRRLLLGVSPIVILAILFNDRRICIATGGIGVMFILLLQSPKALLRRRVLLASIATFGFLYLTVGWFGPETPVTAPVKGFKEGVRAELFGENTDNSSWYRKVERYNLRHTVKENPVLGTGLGVRYKQLITLDKLSFEYFVYISHNQVLLVHSATGTIGYVLFLLFFLGLISQLTIHYRYLPVGWHRAIALVALLSMMNWMIVAWYDMQLFFYRNSFVMAFAVGMSGALFRIDLLGEKPDDEPKSPDRS